MPKDPPYYSRITFRVTLTQFLRTAENIQVDYDYAIGQQGMRHYGTFRMHSPIADAHMEALLHGTEAMVRKHLDDVFVRDEPKDADVYFSLVHDDPGGA